MADLYVAQNAAPSKVSSKRPSKAPNSGNKKDTKANNATITIPLSKNDAAAYNECSFNLENATKITLERPKTNKDGSYILTIEQPQETQNLKSQITEYCAFDGEKHIGGQIDSHTIAGETKINYYTCDQKDSECDITDRGRYASGDTNLKPYFENGKLVRRTQAEIQDKTPDKVEDEIK